MSNLISNATFFGIGVGPGDPELLTVKALRILKTVDLIFCPSSGSNTEGFARRILAPYDLPAEKFRQVTVTMSRDRTTASEDYRQAAEEIAAALNEGLSVAWITEGDPLFFSTFIYVAEELRRIRPHVSQQVVPGVTSIQAAAATSGFPLAHLSDRVAVVPAAYGLDHFGRLMREFVTIALIKVNAVFDQLLDELAVVRDEIDAVYIEQIGTPQQRIVTELESLRGEKLPYFSLVLVRRKKEKTL